MKKIIDLTSISGIKEETFKDFSNLKKQLIIYYDTLYTHDQAVKKILELARRQLNDNTKLKRT